MASRTHVYGLLWPDVASNTSLWPVVSLLETQGEVAGLPELFSGTGSFGRAFEARGWEVTSLTAIQSQPNHLLSHPAMELQGSLLVQATLPKPLSSPKKLQAKRAPTTSPHSFPFDFAGNAAPSSKHNAKQTNCAKAENPSVPPLRFQGTTQSR